MTFIRTTNRGSENYVVFTGSQYVFFDSFWGIVAVAKRRETNNPNIEETTFDVEYSDEIQTSVFKRVINSNENKYITKKVTYNCTMTATCKGLDYYAELNVKHY